MTVVRENQERDGATSSEVFFLFFTRAREMCLLKARGFSEECRTSFECSGS